MALTEYKEKIKELTDEFHQKTGVKVDSIKIAFRYFWSELSVPERVSGVEVSFEKQ